MRKSSSWARWAVSVALGSWLLVEVSGAQPSARKPATSAERPATSAAPAAAPSSAPPAASAAETESPQTILAPGLYLFQTRTRDGSCNDAQRTGYVTSAVATLDGVPGARTMTMQLLNSKWWPTWTLTVSADNVITGTANMGGAKDGTNGSSRFEMRLKKERFQGVGARSYPAQVGSAKVTCTLNYDALLKLLD